jgi:hypothetical protein
MLSVGLWWWYINITITILDIIHRPVFYLKLNSTLYLTGSTLRLRYEPNGLMLSVGLWWWYINKTNTILDIIHRPVFYLKHDVSETGYCLCFQVEPTKLGPIERANFCLIMSLLFIFAMLHEASFCNSITNSQIFPFAITNEAHIIWRKRPHATISLTTRDQQEHINAHKTICTLLLNWMHLK